MSANILRFNIKGNVIDIYRNGKTWGNSFFKHCADYPDLIKVKDNKVSVTPYAISETIKDMFYYIHCKNEEFEDGIISQREHKDAHEWFDYHYTHIANLMDLFSKVLDYNEEWDDTFVGEWTKL